MHRADLLGALARALPAERIHLGHRLAGFDRPRRSRRGAVSPTAPVPTSTCWSAPTASTRWCADLLFGPGQPASPAASPTAGWCRPSGCATSSSRSTRAGLDGPGRHFVHYFVSGRRLVNFVAIVEQDTWTRESWTDRGELADALAAFAGWHPQVRAILARSTRLRLGAVRPRAARALVGGRVTLLGDACHADAAVHGPGRRQAIEDGATLAACLADGEPTCAGALRRYERLRMPRRRAAGDVDRPTRRASTCATGPTSAAATPRWRRLDRLVVQGRRLDLRARRGGGLVRPGGALLDPDLERDRRDDGGRAGERHRVTTSSRTAAEHDRDHRVDERVHGHARDQRVLQQPANAVNATQDPNTTR